MSGILLGNLLFLHSYRYLNSIASNENSEEENKQERTAIFQFMSINIFAIISNNDGVRLLGMSFSSFSYSYRSALKLFSSCSGKLESAGLEVLLHQGEGFHKAHNTVSIELEANIAT